MIELFIAHPFIWTLVVFPVVSFAVTWFAKPRSPEEFAAMNPYLAAFLKLVGAIGFDAPKILDAISQLYSGKVRSAVEQRTK